MPRTLSRLAVTVVTSLMLLLMTALPAMAASGTKPDPAKDEYLVGSLAQLGTASIVGIVIGILAVILMGPDTSPADDHH